jgi:hypothetical protein
MESVNWGCERRLISDMLVKAPGEVGAVTVFLSTPDETRYSQFVNLPGATMLYMPGWTDAELSECRWVCSVLACSVL